MNRLLRLLTLALMLLAALSGSRALADKGLTDGEGWARFGKSLFFDTSLSRDGKVSCATCHKPERAFSDGRKVAVGFDKQTGTRNTPSLLDLGDGPFFWDGRSSSLDDLVLRPFTNPVEMGLHGEAEVVARVRQSTADRAAFASIAPNGQTHTPTAEDVRRALVAYIRSIPSGTSAFDRYSSGDTGAISAEARRGLLLFSSTGHCAECHTGSGTGTGTRFSDNQFHSTLINPKLASRLPDRALQFARSRPDESRLGGLIASDSVTAELGRYVVSLDPREIGAFRTPSLRNVAATAPYMHDGSATTLRDAVDREIYYRSLQRNEPNTLTEQDRRDLVAFLESLTATP